MTTNATGNYQFSNLPPGDYYITVTPPAGYEATPVSGGDPDTNLSDTDNNGTQVGGIIQSPVFTLTTGGEVNDGDAFQILKWVETWRRVVVTQVQSSFFHPYCQPHAIFN